jgi:putative transposase
MPYSQPLPACKFCDSSHVIRYGKQNKKQVYKCKTCKRKFVPNKGFEKRWFEPKIIAITLDLYFKGVSYRKIADHLRQFYGISVDHSTVYRWVKRYIGVIGDYISSLDPVLGNVWHADEMKIRIGGDWRWLWNVMDKRTRYQLVGLISESRKVEDAQKAFRQSKRVGKKKPKLIITDGLQSYKGAFKSEFHDNKFSTRYAINSGFGLNSFIERMQENIREREKIMHGLKNDNTPFVEGSRIYYNFIRPHLGLYGTTPAEMAGVGVNGSWEELLRRSIEGRK